MKKVIIIVSIVIAMFLFTLPVFAAGQYYDIEISPIIDLSPLYFVFTDGDILTIYNTRFAQSEVTVNFDDIQISNSPQGYVITNMTHNNIIMEYYDTLNYQVDTIVVSSSYILAPNNNSIYISEGPKFVSDNIPINSVTIGGSDNVILNSSGSETTTEEITSNNNSDNGIVNLGSLFDIITTWIRNIVSTIVSKPILMIGLGIFITGSVIGLSYRLIRG